jgi:hypothetical protein
VLFIWENIYTVLRFGMVENYDRLMAIS